MRCPSLWEPQKQKDALGYDEEVTGQGQGQGKPRPLAFFTASGFWNVTFRKCQWKSSLTEGLEAKANSEILSGSC